MGRLHVKYGGTWRKSKGPEVTKQLASGTDSWGTFHRLTSYDQNQKKRVWDGPPVNSMDLELLYRIRGRVYVTSAYGGNYLVSIHVSGYGGPLWSRDRVGMINGAAGASWDYVTVDTGWLRPYDVPGDNTFSMWMSADHTHGTTFYNFTDMIVEAKGPGPGVWVKSGGTWHQASEVYVNRSGTWNKAAS